MTGMLDLEKPFPAVMRVRTRDLGLLTVYFIGCVVSIQSLNVEPLLPLFRTMLPANEQQLSWLSSAFFLGMLAGNLLGGLLADRLGSQWTMARSLEVLLLSTLLTAFTATLAGMVVCRALCGVAAGGALVGGARILSRHPRPMLARGLFGGMTTLGQAVGLWGTPLLLSLVGWQVSLWLWSLPLVGVYVGVVLLQAEHSPVGETAPLRLTGPATFVPRLLRCPTLLLLGIVNAGTFGLSNALSACIVAYFLWRQVPMSLAASYGAAGLLLSIITRPLGGWLAGIVAPGQHLLAATLVMCLGVLLLVAPLPVPVLVMGWGLVVIGSSTPYAAIFASSSQIAETRGIGAAFGQGVIVACSAPGIVGSTWIALIEDHTHHLSLAMSIVGLFFGLLAVGASFLVLPTLSRCWQSGKRKTSASESDSPLAPLRNLSWPARLKSL